MNISKETFKIVKEGLYSVVNEKGGTAYWYRPKTLRWPVKQEPLR